MTKNTVKQMALGTLAFLFVSSLKCQTTVTLTPTQDAAIGYHDGASTAGNNYGTASQNAAYCIPAVASATGVNLNRALIDFSLSTIPPGATILSANLNLYALGPTGSLPGHSGTANSAYLQRINQSWQELVVTWNSQPTSVAQNQVVLNQSSSATQNYLNINVTNLVIDMKNNPASSFGFMLKLVNETVTNSLLFASREYSNSALQPKLVVTYAINHVGINNNEKSTDELDVYPNPSSGCLFFKSPLFAQHACQVSIETMEGKQIETVQLAPGSSQLEFNRNRLVPGIYLCKFNFDNNLVMTKKISITGID